jgi:hypothetical protein
MWHISEFEKQRTAHITCACVVFYGEAITCRSNADVTPGALANMAFEVPLAERRGANT